MPAWSFWTKPNAELKATAEALTPPADAAEGNH